MSNHITEWLNAYLDGELRNGRLHQVEAHLAECSECQAELDSLQSLSSLLHQEPVPEFISTERFAAQVNLRLPHTPPAKSKRSALEVGWWMIPVSLLLVWILLSTFSVAGRVAVAANDLGLLSEVPAWLTPDSSQQAEWSETLGEFGLLDGNNLAWAEFTETFTRSRLPQIVWQVSIGFVYLSWIAILWVRHSSRENGQLLES